MSENNLTCPECGFEASSPRGFNCHWGHKHDGPTPDAVDNSPEVTDQMRQKLRDANSGENNPHYGTELSDEHKAKLSDAFSGENNPNYGGLSKEHKENLSEATSGEKHWNYGKERPEEVKQKISETESETMKENYRTGKREPPSRNPIEVEKTGHIVDSKPEKWVDLLLHETGLDYDREPRYDVGDRNYFPDFKIDDTVIEVKGWPVTNKALENAELFMVEYPSKEYIVLSCSEQARIMPCDNLVRWVDREDLVSLI